MKIVIDIPEKAYELLKNEGVDWLGAEHILDAVANGTPLPTDAVDRVTIKEYLESFGKDTNVTTTDTVDRQSVTAQSCEDAISRQAAIVALDDRMSSLENVDMQIAMGFAKGIIHGLPPVTPQPNMWHCKDCKYFENDSWAKVDGIPLIVAHKICKRWGNECQTKEDGYCFLFESKKQEETRNENRGQLPL